MLFCCECKTTQGTTYSSMLLSFTPNDEILGDRVVPETVMGDIQLPRDTMQPHS